MRRICELALHKRSVAGPAVSHAMSVNLFYIVSRRVQQFARPRWEITTSDETLTFTVVPSLFKKKKKMRSKKGKPSTTLFCFGLR